MEQLAFRGNATKVLDYLERYLVGDRKAYIAMYGSDNVVSKIEDITSEHSYDTNKLIKIVHNPKFLGLIFISNEKPDELTDKEREIMRACSVMKKCDTEHVKISTQLVFSLEESVCGYEYTYKHSEKAAKIKKPISSSDLGLDKSDCGREYMYLD